MKLDDLVFIDFEMADTYCHNICAVGMCTVQNGVITDAFYSLINPQCRFDPMISELTGITEATVADAPTFPEIWTQIRPLLENKTVVAHGAGNDLQALSKTLGRYKIKWHSKINYACTYILAQSALPEGSKLGLERLCEYFCVDLSHHHNALSDARACAGVFLRLLEEYPQEGFAGYSFDMLTAHGETPKTVQRKKRGAVITEKLKLLCPGENEEKKLVPGIPPDKQLGIPYERVKKLAAELHCGPAAEQGFLHTLPHTYYEENLLHAFIINRTKNQALCIKQLEAFLPYAGSVRAVCCLAPKSFAADPEGCRKWLDKNIASKRLNTAVFACECYRRLFSGELNTPEINKKVANMKHGNDRRVQSAQARYFSRVFSKHPEEIAAFIAGGSLKPRTAELVKERIYNDRYKYYSPSFINSNAEQQ